MKKLFVSIILSISIISGFSQCSQKTILNYIPKPDTDFINCFNAKLKKARPQEKSPSSYFSVILYKNRQYTFYLHENIGFEGRVKINIFHNKKLLATTASLSGKNYNRIQLNCKSTGRYMLDVSHLDKFKNKKGCAIVIIDVKKTTQ